MGWALQERVSRTGKLLDKAFWGQQGTVDETSVGLNPRPEAEGGSRWSTPLRWEDCIPVAFRPRRRW